MLDVFALFCVIDYLQQLKISVSGKIVLARYGKLFRGCKVMLAEMRNAVGVILYSDPNDDGYVSTQHSLNSFQRWTRASVS